MCASVRRYSESDPGSGNVAKQVGPQQKIWSFPPMAGRPQWIAGHLVTDADPPQSGGLGAW